MAARLGPRLTSLSIRRALAAAVVASIILLTALRVAGNGGPLEAVSQAALVLGFALLVFVDYRAAVAIVILEVACGGASGHWTILPGGVSGRIALSGLVLAGGLVELGLSARSGRLRLGRYTLHGVVLAIALPGIWMALGLVNGNPPADVFGDGNGHLFFTLTLVLAAVAQGRDLGWLRRWLLVACGANAVLTATIIVVGLSGLVPINTTLNEILAGRLGFGGGIAVEKFVPVRLILGSSLYIAVGMVLVTWELLHDPRRWWPWVLCGVLAFDLVMSLTRGLWLAAGVAVVIVVILGSSATRRLVFVLTASVAIVLGLILGGLVAGSPVPVYFVERAASAFDMGEAANGIKIQQARVLSGHIAERPLLGWGFGTVAPDFDRDEVAGGTPLPRYQYGPAYSYELSYLDLAYKTGLLGLLAFLSFPVRLLVDSIRGRLNQIRLAPGVTPREAAVPAAIIVSILVLGTTNPFLLAAFALAPMILCIAWLDPFAEVRTKR